MLYRAALEALGKTSKSDAFYAKAKELEPKTQPGIEILLAGIGLFASGCMRLPPENSRINSGTNPQSLPEADRWCRTSILDHPPETLSILNEFLVQGTLPGNERRNPYPEDHGPVCFPTSLNSVASQMAFASWLSYKMGGHKAP
jgi:hypothetical protein